MDSGCVGLLEKKKVVVLARSLRASTCACVECALSPEASGIGLCARAPAPPRCTSALRGGVGVQCQRDGCVWKWCACKAQSSSLFLPHFP